MRAVITNPGGKPPCVVYWTGRVKFHVGVVTYCDEERDASDGVLQVPDSVPCCTRCETNVKELVFPKSRG